MKAPPRCSEKNPKEQNLRGDRASQELNASVTAADRHPDQSPEGDVIDSGVSSATSERDRWSTTRGHGPTTSRFGLVVGTNP